MLKATECAGSVPGRPPAEGSVPWTPGCTRSLGENAEARVGARRTTLLGRASFHAFSFLLSERVTLFRGSSSGELRCADGEDQTAALFIQLAGEALVLRVGQGQDLTENVTKATTRDAPATALPPAAPLALNQYRLRPPWTQE
jgi:hypothetical protein